MSLFHSMVATINASCAVIVGSSLVAGFKIPPLKGVQGDVPVS